MLVNYFLLPYYSYCYSGDYATRVFERLGMLGGRSLILAQNPSQHSQQSTAHYEPTRLDEFSGTKNPRGIFE